MDNFHNEYSNISHESCKTSNISIEILQQVTKTTLSTLLNPLKVLPTDDGIPRDWRGLAHLIGLGSEQIPSLLMNNNPTIEVLQLWCKKSPKNSSVFQLQDFLQQLDRWDVYDDTKQLIDQDINTYLQHQTKSLTSANVIQSEIDNSIITIDDVNRLPRGLNTQYYDAFLLFADDDIGFATELIEKMESKHYGHKICVKERDLVGGLIFEHEAILKLITDRCNRLIIILSPAFLKSSMLKFFLNFAQALGIEQKQRKVIPCLYEKCKLPHELSYYFILDYSRNNSLCNFWDKLSESIKAPNLVQSTNLEKKVLMKDADSKLEQTNSILDNVKSEENLNGTNSISKVTFSASTSSLVNEEKSLEQKNSKSLKSWFKKKLLHKKLKDHDTESKKSSQKSSKRPRKKQLSLF